MTCPVLRRRTSRSGAEGRQVVRRTSQLTTRAIASRASVATARLFMASRSRSEPVATMPQNELVAWVPYSPLAGTA